MLGSNTRIAHSSGPSRRDATMSCGASETKGHHHCVPQASKLPQTGIPILLDRVPPCPLTSDFDHSAEAFPAKEARSPPGTPTKLRHAVHSPSSSLPGLYFPAACPRPQPGRARQQGLRSVWPRRAVPRATRPCFASHTHHALLPCWCHRRPLPVPPALPRPPRRCCLRPSHPLQRWRRRCRTAQLAEGEGHAGQMRL